ncbi:MAG TPA: DUF4157 domain-containing protein, partial [Pirellulaceae bacterium]|nr:DUF4157 domain-containing protein [Pirellulaceae bacterium]
MTTKAAPQPQVAPPSPVRSFTPAPVPLLLRKCACGGSSGGECEDCKRKKPMLQRHAAGSAGVGSVPPVVHSVLNSPGQPLDASTRGFMEPRFGHDFSQVRVHTDSQAAESARAVNAHAYTVGQDIAFDRGRYDPHSSVGRQLLAHELAHTVQQSGLQRTGANIQLDEGAQYQSLEREADATASAVMSGAPVSLPSSAPRPILSRVKGDAGKVVPGKKKKSKTIKTDFGSHVVKPVEGFETGQGKVEEFEVNVLYVPAEKGKLAFDEYMKIAGGKLESTVELTGTGRARTALWQTRPSTDDLRKLWLEKLGWSADSRDDLWDRAGGDKEFPKVGKKTCQMDHSIELQLGGDNTPFNIQPLNAGPNQESGRDINKEL